MSDDPNIRLCECGCGESSGVYTSSWGGRGKSPGYRKGEPRRFINGHNARGPVKERKPCECGCGHLATKRFIQGHHYAGRPRLTVAERLESKIERTESCWLWRGSISGDGYGQFYTDVWTKPRLSMAHRLVYELNVGKIEEGKELHHKCHTPLCVNPDHLVSVTRQEHFAIHAAEARSAAVEDARLAA